MTERLFLGRSPAGGRVGIYREERDWEWRFYVGKDAETPCAVRRWWTDSLEAWDVLMFHDLGQPTVSTTVAIACAVHGRDHASMNYEVHRHKFNLYVKGTRFERTDDGYTFGAYDLLNDVRLPWPSGWDEIAVWQRLIRQPHHDWSPHDIAR